MSFAKQRDKNEGEIVAALLAAGAAVQKLSDAGVPDLLVSYRDVLHLLEVKNPNAKGGGKYNTGEGSLTATQTKWWSKWTGKKPVIVQTGAEALAAIGAAGSGSAAAPVSGTMVTTREQARELFGAGSELGEGCPVPFRMATEPR